MILFILFLFGIVVLLGFLVFQYLKPYPSEFIFPSKEGLKRGLLTKPQILKLWYDMQIKEARESINRPLIIKDLIVWEKDA